MGRGRPPNPDAVNFLRGDPGRRRRYCLTPTGPAGTPKPPKTLSKLARAEWKRITPMLEGMGVLSKIDASALACYCEAWERYQIARERLSASVGLSLMDFSRLSKVVNENFNVMKGMMVEFGITPAARARMKVKPQEKPKESKWEGLVKLA